MIFADHMILLATRFLLATRLFSGNTIFGNSTILVTTGNQPLVTGFYGT
jgi:hypothetical protein